MEGSNTNFVESGMLLGSMVCATMLSHMDLVSGAMRELYQCDIGKIDTFYQITYMKERFENEKGWSRENILKPHRLRVKNSILKSTL
ncbi:unnamed protein product [Citrullus colocynthis]|uniref:Uncharacterized protein n=1 Tax=Citrullus colocynthis TaxID=252529 RepID=A0ABP0XP20_9ROSI